MIYLWIAILLAIIAASIAGILAGEQGVLVGLCIGAFSSIIPSLIVYSVAEASFDTKNVIAKEIDIVALNDNAGIKGQFFLGSGSIESNLVYFYMTKSEEGFQIHNVENDSRTYLVEDNNVKPMIVEYKKRFKDDQIEKWFGFDSGNISKRKIYIPKNSILTNYKVDME